MVDVLGAAVVIMLFGGVAVMCLRVAIRTWKDPRRFGETVSYFRMNETEATANGLARGIAVFAWQWVCMACAVISEIISMTSRSDAWMAAAGTFFIGFFAAFLFLLTIRMFNRPRFLVVPYMRHLDRTAIRRAQRRL